MAEKYLQLYQRLRGLRTLSLRVANPFGPFQSPYRRQGVVPALIETYLARQPVELWGDGRVVRDFLYVGDLAEAIVKGAAYEGPDHVMNLGSGIGRSLLDLVRSVAVALDLPEAPVVHKPARQGDVPANVLDIGRARQALGWEPRTD